MSVEKVQLCGEWQLCVALFTDVTNLNELRQSVIDGQLDVALISPSMVCVCGGEGEMCCVGKVRVCWSSASDFRNPDPKIK